MTPSTFIRKWKTTTLKERSAAPEHFTDLFRLLDEPTPNLERAKEHPRR